MKKLLVLTLITMWIMISAWVIMLQTSTKATAQQQKEKPEAKQQEKLKLFDQVTKAQDSTLDLLRDKKKQPVKKKPKGRIDTLLVKGTTIVTPVETLPDTYYLVQDSTIVAKKKITLWQKIFGKRKRNQ